MLVQNSRPDVRRPTYSLSIAASVVQGVSPGIDRRLLKWIAFTVTALPETRFVPEISAQQDSWDTSPGSLWSAPFLVTSRAPPDTSFLSLGIFSSRRLQGKTSATSTRP